MLDELGRQIQQLAAPAVDDRNLQVFGDQHDALAHVLQRQLKLSAFCRALASVRRICSMAARISRVSTYSGDGVDLQIGPGALEDVVVVDADAYPERMAADLADGDQPGFAGRCICRPRRSRSPSACMWLRQLAAVQVLAQLVAVYGVAAAGADHAVAADHGDRARRSEIDLVVEGRKVHRIERRHNDAADAAVALHEAARELHRPLAARSSEHRLADVEMVLFAVS